MSFISRCISFLYCENIKFTFQICTFAITFLVYILEHSPKEISREQVFAVQLAATHGERDKTGNGEGGSFFSLCAVEFKAFFLLDLPLYGINTPHS